MCLHVVKRNLDLSDLQTITLPKNSEILTVKCTSDGFTLFASAKTEQQETTDINILVLGDEDTTHENIKYIASTTFGSVKWHFFEELHA